MLKAQQSKTGLLHVTVPSILAEKEARLRLVLEYLRERELPKVVEDEHRVEADFYFSA